MNLKKSYKKATGYTTLCKIGECSLKMLEFGIIELEDGEKVTYNTEDKETAFILLEGYCTVKFDDVVWEHVGNRNTVFENRKAVSFYMPIEQELTIEGNGHVKIAVCGAPIKEKTEPQLLLEEHVVLKTLGIQPYERQTSFIIDGNSNAKVLTIGECYTTPGNWAGFPPHKHDEDNMPAECIAEEIYYFLFEPQQGFAVQCVYTADGIVDEAYRVKNDELVEFPYGYHTTVSTPGYSTYFLWLMAGEHQGFNRSNDPEHDWITKLENK
ncbi:MAG: 5-deoxy-glucuronate isomerase [Lachnospiraceae bacterium]|jgi:5-deoxy-glucuronate isomerase|nr:5-deoxy-glucuronate isomerase [Lachnospiraceae bacterium]